MSKMMETSITWRGQRALRLGRFVAEIAWYNGSYDPHSVVKPALYRDSVCPVTPGASFLVSACFLSSCGFASRNRAEYPPRRGEKKRSGGAVGGRKKRRFRAFYVKVDQNWPAAARWEDLWTQNWTRTLGLTGIGVTKKG